MEERKNRMSKMKDRIGKETSLRAFESFWLFLDSCGSLTLHGCEKIITCTAQEISVACSERIACVLGKELLVRSLDLREIEIGGNIESVIFKEKEPEHK